MARRDLAIELPKVADTLVPAVVLGKEAEIRRCLCRTSVPAKVVGIDSVTPVRQRRGQSGIAPGVLGKPMHDLDDRLGRGIRRPAIGEERDAVRRLQGEGRSQHGVTSLMAVNAATAGRNVIPIRSSLPTRLKTPRATSFLVSKSS